ncbi:MAG: sugar ABC transporter permease [Rubrobacteraceae bacterium]|nr:sugar ABC transporter permease [Rubrobacteraceae bacterium]
MNVEQVRRTPAVRRTAGGGGFRSWWGRNQRKIVPYLFITPNLVVFTLFMFIPIIGAFYVSLTKWSLIGSPTFIGIENYVQMFTDPNFWKAFYNTFIYTVGTVPTSIALGLLVAMGLNRRLPGRTLLRSIYFVPVIISLVAAALIAAWMFNDNYGVINSLLNAVGLGSVHWLSSATWAMPSLIITTLWIRLGFNMVIYLAALQGISPEVYDAANIDGAKGWKLFRYVTWPLLAPTTFLVLIINIIYSTYVFDLIYVMTGGGPGFSTTVLVQYVYQEAFQQGDMGYASAIGVFLYVLLMVFTLFQWRVTRQGEQAS